MPTVRTAGTPNHHHQAQCSPTLELMESIAATLPEAIEHAKGQAWSDAVEAISAHLGLSNDVVHGFHVLNPYRHAPEQDTEAA